MGIIRKAAGTQLAGVGRLWQVQRTEKKAGTTLPTRIFMTVEADATRFRSIMQYPTAGGWKVSGSLSDLSLLCKCGEGISPLRQGVRAHEHRGGKNRNSSSCVALVVVSCYPVEAGRCPRSCHTQPRPQGHSESGTLKAFCPHPEAFLWLGNLGRMGLLLGVLWSRLSALGKGGTSVVEECAFREATDSVEGTFSFRLNQTIGA